MEGCKQCEERLIVLAPTKKDAAACRAILGEAGIACTICPDLPQVCREISAGAAAVVLTEEALAQPDVGGLIDTLAAQPNWSELPVLVLVQGGAESPRAAWAMQNIDNVMLLERPVQRLTMVSAVQSAVKSRRRQYRLREYLAEQKRTADALRASQEELKAAKDSAERAKATAERANRAKDHFLAVLSHELRTPLTPVVMGVSMLQRRSDLDQQMRETLEMVRRNVEMEARLIDDLLDVTRISRGKLELNRSPVELCTVINRAVEVCKPDIEARRLDFGVDLGSDAPYWVEADVARLQQVFWNLLKNAVKFTPHDGCVGIRCRRDGEHVVVEVNDSGIGIEADALPRIFNAFEQAELSISRQFGGLGLGLAICKALVELHGGTISAHSEGRDKGATFRVRLPLSVPAARPKIFAPAPTTERAARPLRILLVEDHGVTSKMMKMVLSVDSHQVEMAGDVATALKLADQQPFDLLLSDLGLPDGSGHDLLRALRARGYSFPAIALSGYGQPEDIERSYRAGFASHLTKPASREAVVEAIASAVAAEPRTTTETMAGKPIPIDAGAAATATSPPPAPVLDADVFDKQEAVKRCFGREEALWTMVDCFFNDMDKLLPEMRSALQKGDVEAVGNLGHRLKGTLVYLGARRATEAAARVERFAHSGGQRSDAEEAVDALEQQCKALKTALVLRRTPADLVKGNGADSTSQTQGHLEADGGVGQCDQAEQSLRQAGYEAHKADQAKNWLLTHVGHDLRTPMNAILGMVDLALEKNTDRAVHELLQTAKESAEVLLARLSDLLDYARIQMGKMELLAAPFSLRRVLNQTTRALTVRASHKGIALSCAIPPEVPDALVGDEVRLGQVLLNLAGNGVTFTEQGEVAISVRVESQSAQEVCLEFVVRDTGIGIPHSDLDRIFKPFREADAATPRRFGGTGLGLTICAALVAGMRGRIWVQSEPGKGSSFFFTVRLPLAKGLPAEAPTAPEISASAVSLRVLLVEDDPANQKLVTLLLSQRGHTVEIAQTGRQAIRMAQENDYDAILMDLSMPGMDGLQTTAAIRAREKGRKRVPIIAVTAYAMRGDREECLEAGMDAYVSKPIDSREMIAVVEGVASKVAPAEHQFEAGLA